MATATFILGLCGSGKSWLADQIEADIKFHEGFWLEHRRRSNIAAMRATLEGGGNVVVTEIEFCTTPGQQAILRALAGVPNLQVQWICIENDVKKANDNCRRRQRHGDAQRQIEINERLSPQYNYPAGCEVRPMWPFEAGLRESRATNRRPG